MQTHPQSLLALRRVLTGAVATLWTPAAQAHAKWFVPFDITSAPQPIGQVLTDTFVWFLLASAVAVYLFFLLDRYLYKAGILATLDRRLKLIDKLSFHIMRGSAAVLFVALWGWGAVYGRTFYLTPELKTTLSWVPCMQLALGLCALWSRSAPLTGLGIFVLYGFAVSQFGIFHLLDYIIFPGIGYFLAVFNAVRLRKSGFIALFASMGMALIWVSIEKFAYPQWTYSLLAQNPELLLGLDPKVYIVMVGFIEFSVPFILLGAVSAIGRLVALGFQAIFVLAIAKFGLIEAVGHLMIIATLLVLVVHGPIEAREVQVLGDKPVWAQALIMTGLYLLTLALVFVAYYGLHDLAYREAN